MADNCISSLPENSQFVETSWLIGCILSSIAYGILLLLALACFTALRKRKHGCPRVNRGLNAYVVLCAIVGTIAEVIDVKATIHGLVDNVCLAFHMQPPNPYVGPNIIIFLVVPLLSDGLLVWRCYAITRRLGEGRWSALLWLTPLLVYAGILGLSGFVIRVVTTVAEPQMHHDFDNILPYLFGISLFLNILITSSIITLLFWYRRVLIRNFGSEHQLPFLRVIPVLVESAGLIVIVDVFVIAAALSTYSIGNIAAQVWIHVQPIASLLIIHRVSQNSDYFSQKPNQGAGDNMRDMSIHSNTLPSPISFHQNEHLRSQD